jgi:hypothetical protein
MEAVATIGVSSHSTFYTSLQDVLDKPQNIYETNTDKKLPIYRWQMKMLGFICHLYKPLRLALIASYAF